MAQAQREPRSASEAWQVARRYEKLLKMEQRGMRLFLPNDGDPKSSTTGYVACVYLDGEGKPTNKYLVGKPFKAGEGDYTKKGGGPYLVDMESNACQCPSFVGTKGFTKESRIIPASEGEGECKHHLGMLYAIATWKYELVPMKGVTDRKLVRWIMPESVLDVVSE